MQTGNTACLPGECLDDKFLRQLMGRTLLYLLRGTAAGLLAPFEWLEHLRRGHRIARQGALSWSCSATMYLCGLGIWLISTRTALDGRFRADEISLLYLAAFITAVVNGRLQALTSSGHRVHLKKSE